jgi:magnesium-dependent phosphatase 1
MLSLYLLLILSSCPAHSFVSSWHRLSTPQLQSRPPSQPWSSPSRASTALEALPKAVVFDLDGCLWAPDMYMLWGGGAPFTVQKDGTLKDCRGSKVEMLGAVPEVLLELKTNPKWEGVQVCIASCTDEPSWAQQCLKLFKMADDAPLKSVMMVEEIHGGNKQTHLRNIAERTGIALEDMLFFDNERGNCVDVSAIGVTVAYVPRGVTALAWDRALANFPSDGIIQGNK